MERIFGAASLPTIVVAMIPHIISTCRSCRPWQRPKPDITPSIELITEQNVEVEADIMFFEVFSIWHMVDRADRWHAGITVKDKSSKTLQEAIDLCWLQIFGPFKVLIIDGEKGIDSAETRAFLLRNGIQLKYGPRPTCKND